MQCFDDYRAVGAVSASAVTIGNFDGVHRGHQVLLERARGRANASGATFAVLTFEPHPARVLAPQLAPPLITTPADKRALLAEAGVELLLAQRFDAAFAALAPDAFVERVLVAALRAVDVVVGYDFSFGAHRAGDPRRLAELGARHGFRVEVVSAQTVGSGLVASSTKVRELVLEGHMEGASLLLGRPYHLRGVVVEGARRGRELGFPTANLRLENELVPQRGVYTGRLDWGTGPQAAVVNVGYNPTFGGDELGVEAHVLDTAPGLDLYGHTVRLEFVRRLRAERRFSGPDALRSQIALDCEAARASLSERGAD